MPPLKGKMYLPGSRVFRATARISVRVATRVSKEGQGFYMGFDVPKFPPSEGNFPKEPPLSP